MSEPSPQHIIKALCQARTLSECVEAIWGQDTQCISLWTVNSDCYRPIFCKGREHSWSATASLAIEADQQSRYTADQHRWAVPLDTQEDLVLCGLNTLSMAYFQAYLKEIKSTFVRCYDFEMATLKAKALQKIATRPSAATLLSRPNGRHVFCSESWTKTMGWSEQEMAFSGWLNLSCPDAIYRHTSKEVLLSATLKAPETYQASWRTSQGETLSLTMKREIIQVKKDGLALILLTINAKEKQTPTIREKMHELNNHLACISGNAELIIMKSNQRVHQNEVQRRAHTIVQACSDSSQLISDLKKDMTSSL